MSTRLRLLPLLTLVATVVASGCSTLLTAEPTPVPGAAATLTRSLRTPIPTTVQTPGPSPALSPGPARPAAQASPSPAAAGAQVNDDQLAQVQRQLEQVTSSAALPGLDRVLLDHVSLSTAQGGSVLDSAQAATWLRDHAGPGIKVTRLERGTETVMFQALTEGWPTKDPIQQGLVNLSLRRYDASGRQNDDSGDWKIDLIIAE